MKTKVTLHFYVKSTKANEAGSIRLMQKVKQDLNKLQNDFLTIDEFCASKGLKYEQVEHLIIG